MEVNINPKSNQTKKPILVVFITIICICYIIIACSKSYSHPGITGKWRSLETGTVIRFTRDGRVKFNDSSQVGKYQITSPSQMEYTIDNKTFIMDYALEGRKLNWGQNKTNLEPFARK